MMRMLFVVVTTLFVLSCQQKRSGAFEVSGVVKNAPGRKLSLMETPYTNAQPVILDSVNLDKDGRFLLKGRASEEGLYRLLIENGPDVVLVNDNNDITVNLDVNDYRNYTVEGSPASESLHKLFEDYREKDSAILEGFKRIDSLRSKGYDSLVEVLQTGNDKKIEDLNGMLKNFVNTSGSPSAALYALGIASQTIGREELKNLLNATAKRFPEHTATAKINRMLTVQNEPQPAKEYPLLNQPAPNLTMKDVNGNDVSVASFRGKYVLIDFWASWCAPCRQENPNVVAAYNRFKNKNFTVLGVSLDDDEAAWKKAIEKDNLTWTHMSDLKQWESSAVQAYAFEAIPFNVLIDPQGKIIASALRGSDLEKKLELVLK